jgi:hypothetical protein
MRCPALCYGATVLTGGLRKPQKQVPGGDDFPPILEAHALLAEYDALFGDHRSEVVLTVAGDQVVLRDCDDILWAVLPSCAKPVAVLALGGGLSLLKERPGSVEAVLSLEAVLEAEGYTVDQEVLAAYLDSGAWKTKQAA